MDDETPIWLTDAQAMAMAVVRHRYCCRNRFGPPRLTLFSTLADGRLLFYAESRHRRPRTVFTYYCP